MMCAMPKHGPSKSKQIKDAHKRLSKELAKHVEVTTDAARTVKKTQRQAAKVAAAAQAYADAVEAKTGLANPFIPGLATLDAGTLASLRAERGRIERALAAGVPVAAYTDRDAADAGPAADAADAVAESETTDAAAETRDAAAPSPEPGDAGPSAESPGA